MKIAISTDHGYVSAHFGRCASYTIVDISEGRILSRKEIPNPGHQPGFLPQFLSERGVNAIIAGGMGPRAQALFSQKNIETIIGIQGPIDEVIKKFLAQELEAGEDMCNHKSGKSHRDPHHDHSEHSHSGDNIPAKAQGSICFTALGTDLKAEIDPNFGRAHYFLVVDPKTKKKQAIENPNRESIQGAGIQSAQLMVDRNVGLLITGQIGPNAQRVLESSGIKVITGASGKIADVLEKFKTEVH